MTTSSVVLFSLVMYAFICTNFCLGFNRYASYPMRAAYNTAFEENLELVISAGILPGGEATFRMVGNGYVVYDYESIPFCLYINKIIDLVPDAHSVAPLKAICNVMMKDATEGLWSNVTLSTNANKFAPLIDQNMRSSYSYSYGNY